jgi:hypothetical protein
VTSPAVVGVEGGSDEDRGFDAVASQDLGPML